jgi:hypothetical protein
MAPIWGGSRVRVVTSWDPNIPEGSTGVNLGQRQGEPGSMTLLVRLDDGREVRLPLLALEPITEAYVPDGHGWKTDIPTDGPNRHIRTVSRTEVNGVRYELRGSSMRWFVTREPVEAGPDARTERTPFYPNQRKAQDVYDELIS